MKCFLSALLLALAVPAFSAVTFDFETSTQLSSPLISGDKTRFIRTTSHAQSGTNGLKFDYSTEDHFQSWTYDLPFTIQDGTISVWFYDSIGIDGSPFPSKVGGSIILEDKDSLQDFLAVEIWNGPYPGSQPGAPNYFLTRGNASANSTFKSNYFGDRGIGWHQVVFTLNATQSKVTVDGVENADTLGIVAGPGTNKNLRLRFMADSATNGGSPTNANNWVNNPTPSSLAIIPDYVYYDDLTVTATTPAANTVTEGFEVVSGTPTYDAPEVFMTSAKHDNVQMDNLVPQWKIETAAAKVHSGTQSIHFGGGNPLFKSLTFDLATAVPGDITLSLYDALGVDGTFDKIGGSVILEQVSNPRNFIALEVWNAPYPFSGDPDPSAPNYFLYKGNGAAGSSANFYSRYFGNRSTAWQTVKIVLTATDSRILVNNVENSNGAGLVLGPGLNDGPLRLRLMGDSPSLGGAKNWADSSFDELDYLYLNKTASYLTFDDVVLPITAPSAVQDWNLF